MKITEKEALKIVSSIVDEVVKRNKQIVVVVADSHGEMLAFLRMEKVKLTSIQIAMNKAWTAARTQKTTMDVGKAVRDKEKGYDISYYGDPRITGFGGGVPFRYNDVVIGAVAVSGLSQEEDEELALFGIQQILK